MMVSTIAAALLCACSPVKDKSNLRDETQQLSPRVIKIGDPVPKGGGVFKIGKPYLAGGKWYTPRYDRTYDEVGLASWYGDFFHGRQTANGEVYDMNALSAAHPTLPMPVYARVTNLNNHRSIIVRINDRGPYREGRIIDLSRRAAEKLGFHNQGLAAVRVQYYGPAPLDGDTTLEESYASRKGWAAVVEERREPERLMPQARAVASLMAGSAAVSAGTREPEVTGSLPGSGGWSVHVKSRASDPGAAVFASFGHLR